MADLQAEIAIIEERLESLRRQAEEDESAKDRRALNAWEESLVAYDPAIEHMLVVELCQLAAIGDAEGVEILMSGGVSPNCRDYNDRTPLHVACCKGHREVVSVLLKWGADVSLADNEGITPIQLASINGHTALVHQLTALIKAPLSPVASSLSTTLPTSPILTGGGDVTPSSSPHSLACPHALDHSALPQPMVGSLVVIMVGLPGRGKSYISTQIRRYFEWSGLPCLLLAHKAYAKAVVRPRSATPPPPPPEAGEGEAGAAHLERVGGSADDRSVVVGPIAVVTAAADTPRKEAPAALSPEADIHVETLIARETARFLGHKGGVVIIDGTYTTAARRRTLFRAIKDTACIGENRVVFVEIINTDKETVRCNVERAKAAMESPSPMFVEDYYARMARHEAAYKTLNPVNDRDLTYIQIEDRKNYSLNNISGWMPSRLSYMLHNLSHSPVDFYLTRAGQYVDMVCGRIGGNSRLTERGRAYSEVLFHFFQKELGSMPFTVMTSCAKRCTQTVHYFAKEELKAMTTSPVSAAEPVLVNCRVAYFPTLDDVNHGDCEGQYLSDIKATLPSTVQSMQADPYNTAWPNGESIHQVFNARLEPHIHDIQASDKPMLVVSHLHLLQGLYSFFVTDKNRSVAPQNAYEIDIPFECVVKIHFSGIGRDAEVIDLTKEVDAKMLKTTGKLKKESRNEDFNVFRKFKS